MNWKITDAKRRFSKLIREAEREPQGIYYRDRLVAAVIDADLLEELLAWKRRRERPTVAEAFERLRHVRGDEGPITTPPRGDR